MSPGDTARPVPSGKPAEGSSQGRDNVETPAGTKDQAYDQSQQGTVLTGLGPCVWGHDLGKYLLIQYLTPQMHHVC